MRALRALPAGLACLALAAGCGSDDPVESRGDFVGLVTEDVFAGDEGYREEMLEKQAEAGIGLIRQTFDWTAIEPEKGRFDFSTHDAWMEKLAKQRMEVLPILFNPPPFHSAAPAENPERGTYPPADPQDIAAFARAAAERYGPNGSFWDDHDVPKTPVRSWQVWNEPNIPVYWPSGPDAGEYTQLLRAAARAIREVDPEAEIVTAGLPKSDLGVPFQRFLDDMLDAGAGEVADTIAIHPYSTGVAGSINAIRQMRRTLGSRELDNPIWITEIGWATQGPDSPFTVGMTGQAERIEDLLARIGRLRQELGVRGLVYYNWRDSGPFEGGSDFFGLHTGLLTLNAVEKPGFATFSDGAQGLAR